MKTLVSTLLLLMGTSVAAFGQDGKVPSEKFLVRISDSQLFSHATAGPGNIWNCLVVLPNGRMQLELFRQEFFGSADVKSYEARLNDSELQILTDLLNEDAIENLPEFVRPTTPMRSDEMSVFIMDIQRKTSLKTVGFFDWKGAGPSNAEEELRNWQKAESVLQPLVEWSRSAKRDAPILHWSLVKELPASCLTEGDDLVSTGEKSPLHK